MNDSQLLNLWQVYSQRLEKNLQLSRQNALEITHLKVQSRLRSVKPLKIFAVITGILWVFFLDMLIVRLFHFASPFFLISAIIQALLTKAAIGIYIYQLVLIHSADISEPVLSTQAKLARLRSSTLWVARLLFLQLPVWTTWYLNAGMLENSHPLLFLLQGAATLSAACLAVWLAFNIKYENRDKKWFRLMFSGKEWDTVIQSIALLKESTDYEEAIP